MRERGRPGGGWGVRGPCGRSVCLWGAGSRGRLLQAPRRRLRRPESGSVRPLPSELLPPPPCPDRPPPACSLSRPFVPAPNEEVGSHAGHGPPELNSRRGVPRPRPSLAPRPRCPRASSPWKGGEKRGINQKRERRGLGGGSQCLPWGSRASSSNPLEAELSGTTFTQFAPPFYQTLK